MKFTPSNHYNLTSAISLWKAINEDNAISLTGGAAVKHIDAAANAIRNHIKGFKNGIDIKQVG